MQTPISPTIVELCARIGIKWCREAAINGRESTQQNAVVSCGDRRVACRCFSRHCSRRRLAVLLNSLCREVVHVVAELQERSSGAIRRNGGGVEAYRMGRVGISGSRRHYCISCLRPNRFLSAAAKSHQPGKFVGIPCTVPLVSRIESQWYAVRFYTDEWWGRRNALDCGSGSAG